MAYLKAGVCVLLSLTCIGLLFVPGCSDESDDEPAALDSGSDPWPVAESTPDPAWQLQLHHQNSTFSVTAVSADHVWLNGYFTILRSVDGGSTWTDLGHPGAKSTGRLKFITETQGWMVNSEGVYSTSNGGNSWTLRREQKSLDDVCFVNATTAWVALDEIGYFYRTTDGGESWTALKHPGGLSAKMLKFFDGQNGMIQSGRTIYATRDGGTTWEEIFEADASIEAFDALNMDRIWVAVGRLNDKGRLHRTINGGDTWSSVPLSAPYIRGIEFVDVARGWLTTVSSIYRTQDGGATWSLQQTPDIPGEPYYYFSFKNSAFVGSRTGWVTGYNGNTISGQYGFLMKATAEGN